MIKINKHWIYHQISTTKSNAAESLEGERFCDIAQSEVRIELFNFSSLPYTFQVKPWVLESNEVINNNEEITGTCN